MTSRANMNKNNRAYYQRHKEEILARRKVKREEYKEQLTKAKEIIKSLLGCLRQDTNDPQTNYYVVLYMTEAEQFLKDSEVEK